VVGLGRYLGIFPFPSTQTIVALSMATILTLSLIFQLLYSEFKKNVS
jgi:hypothetical protein